MRTVGSASSASKDRGLINRIGWLVVLPILLGASPWERPRTPVIDAKALGVTGLKASDCATCHPAVASEWSTSIHAAAWTDPQFQAELHKDAEVGWLCLNCHTPIANQQQQLVTDGENIRSPTTVLNVDFDASFRSEGVSCLACHWRAEGIATARSDVRAPHPTVHDPELGGDQTCTVCHQATARLEDALVCHFNTGVEKASAGVTQSCTDCHMPAVKRGERHGRLHSWPGSGIGKGERPPPPGLDGLDLEGPTVGADGELRFALINARAGHMLPTGDPERYLEVSAELLDKEGGLTDSRRWRIGQTWVWSPKAEKRADNRLAVGERRPFTWALKAEGAVVRLKVEHVRLSPENLDYHLKLLASGHPGPSAKALKAYPTRRILFERTAAIR